MKNIIIIVVAAAVIALGSYFLLPGGSDQGAGTVSDNQEKESNTMSTSEYLGKTVILKTNMGDITLGFYPEDAPKAVENFIKLAEKGYYNGVTFHRVIKDFMIQGGDPTGTGAGGESIFGGAFEDELNPETASYKTGYQKGVLTMANSGPNTNGSQFFIILKNNPLNNLYTIFGRVEKGQEVVDQIGIVAVDSNDRPLEDVVIEAVIIR